MKVSNICCVSTWRGDRLSIASCSGSMHEACVELQYFRLRPACLRLACTRRHLGVTVSVQPFTFTRVPVAEG